MGVILEDSPELGTRIEIVEDINLPAAGTASYGPHDTRLTLMPTGTVRAIVRLTHSATSTVPAATANNAQVDIGDDGVFELISVPGTQQTFQTSVVIPAAGLAIRTRSSGSATSSPGSSLVQVTSHLSLEVLPDTTCEFRFAGSGCVLGSPYFSGRMSFEDRAVLDTSYIAGAPSLLMIGIQQARVLIPAGVCEVGLVPLVVLPGMTDVNGLLRQSFPVPRGVVGMIFVQQLLMNPSGQGPSLVTTRTMSLTCL